MLSSGMANAGKKREEQMLVSSSKSGSRRASQWEGTDWAATRAAPATYIYMCVEYRHICMPAFPQTKNQRVHSRSSEVNLSWAQKLHAVVCKSKYASLPDPPSPPEPLLHFPVRNIVGLRN